MIQSFLKKSKHPINRINIIIEIAVKYILAVKTDDTMEDFSSILSGWVDITLTAGKSNPKDIKV